MDITRNKLFYILKIGKHKDNEKMQSINIDLLLNQFQYELEEEEEKLKYKQQEIQKNLEFIQEIRKELNIQ